MYSYKYSEEKQLLTNVAKKGCAWSILSKDVHRRGRINQHFSMLTRLSRCCVRETILNSICKIDANNCYNQEYQKRAAVLPVRQIEKIRTL